MTRAQFAHRLAAEMLAVPWTQASLRARLLIYLGAGQRRNVAALAEAAIAGHPLPYPPGPDRLARLLLQSPRFGPVHATIRRRKRPLPAALDPALFQPAPPFEGLQIPRLTVPDDLAEWLHLDLGQVTWFADPERRLARHGARVSHYRRRWIPKSTGARLIEAPLPRLKALQRRILAEILTPVPLHPDAFGFRAGRNCLQGAQRHASEEIVITADLEAFFISVPAAPVHGIFRSLGYPTAVARLLTGLCTTATPQEMARKAAPRLRAHLRSPHLPQGAPTSPALANLAAFRLDCRLAGLMRRSGGHYSRYADDLAFSGDRRAFFDHAIPFLEILSEIAAEEGFRLNPAKTRLMPQGTRQIVTGVTVNQHINLPRPEFDRLKAILTNCRRFGPESQNRAGHPAFRQHLEGRVAWVEQINPHRGLKLRGLLEAIAWG
ncbi:MAG: reverse transcriptase family protein [Pseudomonadota bacterium]